MAKKQHLDPEAVRDFSYVADKLLTMGRPHGNFIRDFIKLWLFSRRKSHTCPFGMGCNKINRKICGMLFPEIVGTKNRFGFWKCPCKVLYLKDVILIAEQAVAWNTQKNGHT